MLTADTFVCVGGVKQRTLRCGHDGHQSNHRCADCIDQRFAAAVLAVHGRAERVPVDAALVGSAEALRVRDAIDAASGGGGGGV